MRICIFAAICVMLLTGRESQAQFTPLQEWEPDPGSSSSQFGAALALSGKRLCVGSPTFDAGGASSRGRSWFFDPKLLAGLTFSNIPATGNVREGAALAALKSDILFGLPGLTVSTFASAGGAVYYNEKIGNSVVLQHPFPIANAEFGKALAVGSKLLVIGAPKDLNGPGPALSGSAYVARTSDFNLMRLVLPSYNDDDEAGAAVAASKKFIAVGAPGTVVSGIEDEGAVHIYNAATFAYIRTLTGADIFGTAPRFGAALVFSGNNLFVGSPEYDFGFSGSLGYAPAAGRVWQFDTRTWAVVRAYNAGEPQSSAHFGAALSADKKLLAVGSPDSDVSGQGDAGKAEVFTIKTGVSVADLSSPVPASQEHFGTSVQVLKSNRVAVGAPFPVSTSSDGKVYVHAVD